VKPTAKASVLKFEGNRLCLVWFAFEVGAVFGLCIGIVKNRLIIPIRIKLLSPKSTLIQKTEALKVEERYQG
jgi:hypothetical protein